MTRPKRLLPQVKPVKASTQRFKGKPRMNFHANLTCDTPAQPRILSNHRVHKEHGPPKLSLQLVEGCSNPPNSPKEDQRKLMFKRVNTQFSKYVKASYVKASKTPVRFLKREEEIQNVGLTVEDLDKSSSNSPMIPLDAGMLSARST